MGDQDNASSIYERLNGVKRRVDELELEIFGLDQQLALKKEDLDVSSDALMNNLQMLRSLESQISVEKHRLKDIEGPGEQQGGRAQGGKDDALERLLVLSKKPWETSTMDLERDKSTREFQRALVASLAKLAAQVDELHGKIADPFEKARKDVGAEASAWIKQAHAYGDGAGRDRSRMDHVEVVWDEGNNAVVSVRLREDQTFYQLLQYVGSYWSLNIDDYSLVDVNGICWPLHGKVKDTLELEDQRVQTIFLRKGGRTKAMSNAATSSLAFQSTANTDVNGAVPKEETEASRRAKQVLFGKQHIDEMEANGKTGLDIHRLELERKFRRGYRYSLSIVRYHVEAFLYLLLLTLVFSFAFFSFGSYDSEPLVDSVSKAFFQTPFDPCTLCSSQRADTVKVYDSIDSVSGFYSFMEGPVQALLTTPNNVTKPLSSYSTLPLVQQYNLLVGKVLLQQLRVQSNCLSDASFYENETIYCYPPYVDGTPNTESYSIGVNANAENATEMAFTWQPAFYKNAWPDFVLSSVGAVGDRFPLKNDGGFYLEMDYDRTTFTEQLNQLILNNWIDSSTRAVIVNFSLYNPNSNLFLVFVGVFQFTVANGVITNAFLIPDHLGTKLSRDGNDSIELSMLYLAVSIYIVFVILFLVDLFQSKDKIAFLRTPRTLIDVVLLILLISTAALASNLGDFSATAATEASTAMKLGPNSTYVELRGVAFAQSAIRALEGCLVVFLVLKGVQYLRMNPEVSFFGRSFSGALGIYNNYVFVFLVFLLAFAALGHFTLGRDEFIFFSYDLALFAVLQTMLGWFRIPQGASYVAGGIWYVIYFYVVFFVGYFCLLRVFIAVTSFSYSKAMDKVRKRGYYWLPNVNQEYRILSPEERKLLRKVQVTDRFGSVADKKRAEVASSS